MKSAPFRLGMLAAITTISLAGWATPVAASCTSLVDLLPDPTTPGAVLFIGTVVAADELTTDLIVDTRYVGDLPDTGIRVLGGRDPDAVTSVEWTPQLGDRFVVAAVDVDGMLVTGTCMQSMPFPDLLDALAERYGEPGVSSVGGTEVGVGAIRSA